MRDQLRALVKLSEIDASSRELDQELRDLPMRIADLRGDVQKLEGLLAREREQLAQAEKLRQTQEGEIGVSNDMLSKARGKTAKAKNAREAEAAEREIEAIRKTIKDREDEFARIGGAIEKTRASLAVHDKELEELRNVLVEEEAKANARIAILEVERAKVTVGRDESVAIIPKNVISQYDRVRAKRGTAVADASNGTCSGCRMQLPPQQYILLQRGETIETCAHCLRLLFHKPIIED